MSSLVSTAGKGNEGTEAGYEKVQFTSTEDKMENIKFVSIHDGECVSGKLLDLTTIYLIWIGIDFSSWPTLFEVSGTLGDQLYNCSWTRTEFLRVCSQGEVAIHWKRA
ncbi:MAG: hypothetical protein KR126chlam1_00362 [Chlamydiae bacterium]|nr:hypothetical protein [Chlamydiota bacterium]